MWFAFLTAKKEFLWHKDQHHQDHQVKAQVANQEEVLQLQQAQDLHLLKVDNQRLLLEAEKALSQ